MIKKRLKTKKSAAKITQHDWLEKPKNQYSWLAELRLISYYDSITGNLKTKQFKKNTWSLIWNPVTKELKGLSNNALLKLKKPLPKKLLSSKAMRDHISFQDYESLDNYDLTTNYEVGEITPAKWKKLGKGKQIDYYSDKFGDGWFYYYHPFGDYGGSNIISDHKVNIYYSPVNNFYKAKGGRLTVTKRGIIY